MRDAVDAIKERRESAQDPNASFANYLHSELRTISDDSAAFIREKVTLYFLQCLNEARNNLN